MINALIKHFNLENYFQQKEYFYKVISTNKI